MNGDEWMQQMLKEERAQNFVRSLDIVPIRPDAEFEAVIGAAFAKGTTREVHTVNGEDGVVIKMAYPRAIAANWYEYMVWGEARDTRWAGVLGKVYSISESGKYLKMERLGDIDPKDYPIVPVIPYWLNDLKPNNFGKSSDGVVKVRDYGVVNLGFDLDEALPYKPAFALQKKITGNAL